MRKISAVVAVLLATTVQAGRDSGGTYTLPNTGSVPNPVVTGTPITSTWANGTLNDIKLALTDSLSRAGYGSMSAPLKLYDGSGGAPGLTFASDTTMGLTRVGANQLSVSIAGTQRSLWTSSGYTVFGDFVLDGAGAAVTFVAPAGVASPYTITVPDSPPVSQLPVMMTSGGTLVATEITGAFITDGSVTIDDLGTGSVSTDELVDLSVTNGKLAGDAVTTDKIAAGGVGLTDLASNSVDSSKIVDGSIVAADLDTSLSQVSYATSSPNTVSTSSATFSTAVTIASFTITDQPILMTLFGPTGTGTDCSISNSTGGGRIRFLIGAAPIGTYTFGDTLPGSAFSATVVSSPGSYSFTVQIAASSGTTTFTNCYLHVRQLR